MTHDAQTLHHRSDVASLPPHPQPLLRRMDATAETARGYHLVPARRDCRGGVRAGGKGGRAVSAVTVTPASIKDRLRAKTVKYGTGGCWVWTGSRTTAGYGNINIGDHQTRYVHRLTWELSHGPIPHGMRVLHRCDLPSCVNPAHLFLGTAKDNSVDMMSKGRGRAQFRHSNNNLRAKLTDALVAELRTVYYGSNLSMRAIGDSYGLSKGTVEYAISRGWKHLG